MPRSPRAFLAPLAALALVGACSATPGATPGTASDAPGDVIAVTAVDYAFQPATLTVPAGEVTFRVTNTGQEEHEFEIFSGDQVVDEVEGLIAGLSKDLTVTLEAGEYRFVCLLADHEQRGMTGTLTVTG